MGWFSDLTHSVSSAFTHGIVDPVRSLYEAPPGGPTTSTADPSLTAAINGQTAALAAQTQAANDAAAAALAAQKDADARAAAASVPLSDSESARAAADNQRRKLQAGSSFGIGLPSQLGAPPVGYRMLSGQ